MSAQNEYKGWYSKAVQDPHLFPHEFMPDSDHLLLAGLINSQVEPDGFSFAVFKPSLPDPHRKDGSVFVVDALGKVLYVPIDFYAHLSTLASEVTALPDTGRFRNTWRVKHAVTCRPIDRLLIKSDGGVLKETSVYGYSETETALAEAVGKYTHLPDELRGLLGLMLESRDDYDPAQVDNQMVEKVRETLGSIE